MLTSYIDEFVQEIIFKLVSARDCWLQDCVKIYGDPDLPILVQLRDFRLATTHNIVDYGSYQAALWHHGEPVAIYYEHLEDEKIKNHAYTFIPNELPKEFNKHLLEDHWDEPYELITEEDIE